ncbi:MAG: PAS domain S-box protein [Thiohalocapsa sp.]|uniref:chemotaxis protein CheB n=1 Tax=Thiohalocapsa sp. TaxID=2497641 RepID=UPI0025DA7775|nr:chemotaxis protein CheB [Thiohalocapsa sp.]MCG6941670.1 PAS domain S-box protein [Thiohalocapsa sp.]
MIVGLGASSGGLEPLEQVLAHLPPDAGLTVVVVQHLEPRQPSILTDLLGRHTAMPVLEAADGMRPEPDHAYVIAPGTLLALADGAFRVTALTVGVAGGAIDHCFRSLAAAAAERAVALLFSGAGHDGTAGLRAIKERGGLTLVQAPETARYASMPRSAIEAGLADHVLPPDELAAKLLEHAGYLASAHNAASATLEAQLADHLERICDLIQQQTGHDFSAYKEGTMLRRIRRRMQVMHMPAVGRYLALLGRDKAEAEALVKDLLVGVTQFFRDPDAFQTLAQRVIPRLIQGRPADAPLRIWVAGCASGEEAYSIAILVREHLERLRSARFVQIFATDLDTEMLAEARAGRYSPAIAEQLSAERLSRWFVCEGQHYQAAKELRELCIFSEHSLIRDPPFSQLDLILCRNVLIYFSGALQRKLVPLLHYALRPGGFLFLGPSEGLAGGSELFETIDKPSRIFRRKETVIRPAVDFPMAARSQASLVPAAPSREQSPLALQQRLGTAFERIVLDEYSTPCAVVNDRGDLILVAGRLDRYFRLPSGAVTTNLVDLLPAALRVELRRALKMAATVRRRVIRDDIPVELDDGMHRLRLTLRPLPGLEADAGLLFVALQDHAPLDTPEAPDAAAGLCDEPALDRLESELRATRAELKTTVEDLESANEELKSANEELISTNEELQSANEELQTSQEELQSLNEELETINAELRQNVEELGGANSDLQSLFASTEIATLFLDRRLRIAKFTPAATRLFHLVDSDVGRSIGDFAPRFEDSALVDTVQAVLRTLTPAERQLQSADGGAWFILRTIPYRTVHNAIAGVVVTFVDISELKRAEAALRESELRYRTLVAASSAVTWSCPPSGMHVAPQPEWMVFTGQSAEEMLGSGWTRAVHPDDLAAAAERWTEAVGRGEPFSNEHRIRRRDGAWRWMSVHAAPIRDEAGEVVEWIGMNLDVTERRQAERALRQALDKAEAGDRMLAALMEHVPEGITICDAGGELRLISRRGQELLGGPHAGKSIQEVACDWQVFMPDGETPMPPAELPLVRALQGQTVLDAELVQVSARGEKLSLLCNAAPIRDGAGNIVGGVVAWRDVSEKKAAEEALLRSREGLSRLADASLSVMAKTDLDDMLQAVAEAALPLTGARLATCGHGLVSGTAIVGGVAHAPHAPHASARPPEEMFQVDKGGVHMDLADGTDAIRLTDAQLRAHPRWWGLPDGHVGVRGLLGVPIRARGGGTNGMILVTDKANGDFTAEDEALLRQLATVASLALQHVAARVSLEESHRRKNHFLAMLGHELRNPLAPIRNSLHVIDHAAPGDATALKAKAVIERQVTHLTRLVDDLLDVTRIARGKIQLQRERLDLCDLIRRAVEDYREPIAQSRLGLEVALPEQPLWINADRIRIAQVIDNLLNNAEKFTPGGGRVVVSAVHDTALGQAILTVRDTGIGIAPDMLPRVFEPFAQADTTLARTRGGLGLGLAMVKGLVEMHGGTASAASAGEGRGAELTVRLPMVPPPRPARLSQARSRPRGDGRRVLIIEDNTDAAESLRMLLGLTGHIVAVALSGPEGVEQVRAFVPDVVLCDIGLPGMDGYEVARTLRKEPGPRVPKLVALSGYAAPDDVARALAAGFDAHLAKPPSLQDLQAILAEAGPRGAAT